MVLFKAACFGGMHGILLVHVSRTTSIANDQYCEPTSIANRLGTKPNLGERPMPSEISLNRRAMIAGSASMTTCLASIGVSQAADPVGRSRLGLVTNCCSIRGAWLRREQAKINLSVPLTFLKHCKQLGAGGMQAALGAMDKNRVRELRDLAERWDLFIDAIVRPPKDKSDLARFEAEIRTAAEVGANAARTVIMPGRRYERFSTIEEFQQFARRGAKMLELAEPIVRKYQLPLAVENHKDHRIDERVALFKKISSQFIGACVDTGNSFALLDDPYETIEALAPYAFAIHLKDQALREYKDGFLLADIPLGEGSFDLKRIVAILRRVKPGCRFALELITRDPLKVPCLTESYWATMPDVRARDLARAMMFVREHSVRELQQVSGLTLEQRAELEDANVAASLLYAREHLGL